MKWNISNWNRSPDGKYTLHDYYSQDFDLIVLSIQGLSSKRQVEQMKQLVEMLDNYWDSNYSSCTTATYYDGSDTNELGSVMSTFGRALVNTPWLPAVDLEHRPYQIESPPILLGTQLYQMTDKLKALLHDHVPYLGADLKGSLMQYLNIKTDISHKELLELLCIWSQAPSFHTSLDHMRQVYIHLARHIDNQAGSYIWKSFEDKMLIFIPSIIHWKNVPSADIDGTFVSVSKVCWTDKTTVLYSMLKDHQVYPPHLPQILAFYYSDTDEGVKRQIKNAFVCLGVAKDMNLECLVELLEFNASLSPSPSEHQIDSFRSITEAILNTVMTEGSVSQVNQDFFVAKVKGSPIFPSKSKKWVSLEGLFFDNDLAISQHFLKHDQVHFLKWPSSKSGHEQQPHEFIQLCRIPLVNEHVTVTLNPGAVRPYNDLKICFHYIIPLIQRYLITKCSGISCEHYGRVAEILNQLQFLSTLELTCTYCLSNHFNQYYANASLKQCMLESNPPVIYIVVNEESEIIVKMSLVDVLCKLVLPKDFNEHTNLSQVIQELLLENPRSESAQRRFVEKDSLQPVPSEISEWSVDVPVELVNEEEEPVDDESMETEETPFIKPDESRPYSANEGLTAWPPRAPLRMETSEDQQLQRRKVPSAMSSETRQERKITNSDVITFEDVRKMRAEDENGTRQDRRRQEDMNDQIATRYPSTGPTEERLSNPQQSAAQHSHIAEPTHHSNSNYTKLKPENQLQESPPKVKTGSHVSDPTIHGHFPHAVTRPVMADFPQSVDVTALMQTLPIEHDRDIMPNDGGKGNRLAIGRWGEEFVFNLFMSEGKLPNGVGISHIEWLNKVQETYLPYDIKITSDSQTELFIEVKSTKLHDKDLVPISWNEIKFAQNVKKNYLLVRVYSAGDEEKVWIKWLIDLFDILETNPSLQLNLQM